MTVLPAEPEIPADVPADVPEEMPWTPVPESEPVDDSYFDDVAFVGDSRTDGFRLYSGLERGTYFCVTGETVASATDMENWKTEEKHLSGGRRGRSGLRQDLPDAGNQ